MKRILTGSAIFVIFIAIFAMWQHYQRTVVLQKINSYDSCIAANYPIRESYPPQCNTPDGRIFTQDIGNAQQYIGELVVNTPRPNQKITSPLHVKGEAQGTWFFEGAFPISIVDESGNVLYKGFVTAQGEWMTESLVPFQAELEFAKPSVSRGKVIIKNANPSGLSENEKEVVIPVVF